MRLLHKTAIATLALTLTACASVRPVREANNTLDTVKFNMDARFAVNYFEGSTDKSLTGKMQWEDTARATDVILSTPLGNALAAIHITPVEATLKTADHQMFSEKTPEELTYRLLGYELPLSKMRRWMGTKGQPLPTTDQGEWQLEYTKTFTDPTLAKRIIIKRTKPTPLTVTMMIDERSDAPNE